MSVSVGSVFAAHRKFLSVRYVPEAEVSPGILNVRLRESRAEHPCSYPVYLLLTTTRGRFVHRRLDRVAGGIRSLLQGLGREVRMKTARPGRGIIGVDPKNTPPDLTKRTPVYLIRASALHAQVAQSVEQRTENTWNSCRSSQ